MATRERNWDPLPAIGKEGYFLKKPLVDTRKKKGLVKQEILQSKVIPHWTYGITPWQRLFSHNTLCSIRHARLFYRPFVPNDSLDLILASTYDHDRDVFADKVDVLLQPETQGIDTWRLLRNERLVPIPIIVPQGHPLTKGGVTEKKNVNNVKLGLGADHSAQTNAGYSRKVDGTIYAV